MKTEFRELHIKQMTIKWRFSGSFIEFQLNSPRKGWVAIGFNTENNIVNTNLIMAAVTENKLRIEDQFVTGFGQHQKVENLAGNSIITSSQASENDSGTQVNFIIENNRSDKHHYLLKEKSEIYFILAYSMEDDFNHHSIMREHVKVTL